MIGGGSSPGFGVSAPTETSIGFGQMMKPDYSSPSSEPKREADDAVGKEPSKRKPSSGGLFSHLAETTEAANGKRSRRDSGLSGVASARAYTPPRAQAASDTAPAALGQGGKRIQSYFHPEASCKPASARSSPQAVASKQGMGKGTDVGAAQKTSKTDLVSQKAELERQLAEVSATLEKRTGELRRATDAQLELQAQLEQANEELEESRSEAEAMRAAISGMKDELSQFRAEQQLEEQRQKKGREALRIALREQCFRARAEARERLARESVRLGRVEAEAAAFSTTWVQKDGTAMSALLERERNIEQRKQAIEEAKKALRKRKPYSKAAAAAGSDDVKDAHELLDCEEGIKLRGALLAKDQAELLSEKKSLEREAQAHFHELKLVQEFNGLDAQLRDCPALPHHGSVHEPGARGASSSRSQERFVFLDLIATGGFSAVFKAYDLLNYEYVACKLHHVSKEWGDLRKEAFVRHVEREIEITVGVQHRRVVETFAAFEINDSTVVTVMPYCNGGSLADLLRRHGPLAEKDARSIIVQVLYGLLHLHSQKERIIHFDLKPANILFQDGEVRLSDFGLSKVMSSERGNGGMELTSYGSGTHGYLPPECYEGDNSRICPKVDVFSAGVVFFLMLFFPHKPFFKQASQQQIMHMKPHAIIAETEQLEFPGKISAEAQSFLRKCLAPRREDRPDVQALLDDVYISSKSR